jgi:hypothetical protein
MATPPAATGAYGASVTEEFGSYTPTPSRTRVDAVDVLRGLGVG